MNFVKVVEADKESQDDIITFDARDFDFARGGTKKAAGMSRREDFARKNKTLFWTEMADDGDCW